MSSDFTVACYYFPNYHPDPRNAAQHGAGWTEWELVKRAEPRFPGHRQPRVPLWGYQDESDPAVMAMKIDAAAECGIDAFIFDWYWYENASFLEGALTRGFLEAPNNGRMKFSLMWANHDWTDIHPAKQGTQAPTLHSGKIDAAGFDRMTDHIVDDLFAHPSYWLIDGCPYFSLYDLPRLIDGFGSLQATRNALDGFRAKVRARGFRDLHLNFVVWGGLPILPSEEHIENPGQLVRALGCDSVSSYVWIHHVPMNEFPLTSYAGMMEQSVAYWHKSEAMFDVPYFPNVTMGWDSSPRTVQSDGFKNNGYPWTPILQDNTPVAFQQALEAVRDFLTERPAGERIFSINAWNEWTEGSYLEPDTEYGLGYLMAIRNVFGRNAQLAGGEQPEAIMAADTES